MDKKATGIVSYLTLVGWLIAYLAGDREGAKFHLNQSLVLLISGVVASMVHYLPFIGRFAGNILQLVIFIFWVIGFVYACEGKDEEIPVLGSIKILK